MSYLQIKKFVDDQIRLLHTPLVIDDSVRRIMAEQNISEAQMKGILFKCNLQMKRQLRSKYSKQVVHQIVQQVAKAESAKLAKVSEGLETLAGLLSPLALDSFSHNGSIEDRARMISNLAHELPESRYLCAIYGKAREAGEKSEKEDGGSLEKEDGGSRENEDGESPEKEAENPEKEAENPEVKKAAAAEAIGASADGSPPDVMIAQYDRLRSQFLHMNEQLLYNMEKLQYVRDLSRKLGLGRGSGADSDGEEPPGEAAADLKAQMTRFGVLVEKLDFAMS